MRLLGIGATLILFVTAGTALFLASRASGPDLTILTPTRFIGRSASFEATVSTPDGNLTSLEGFIEQAGRQIPLYSLSRPLEGQVQQDGTDRIRVTRRIDRTSHPELVAGEARIVLSATRPILFGLREVNSVAAVDVEVRLDPPRLEVASTFHYVNHGGSELVIYRVSPPDAESGVRVGNRFYPGYPISTTDTTDETLGMSFFALLYDQDLGTPVELYAKDSAGNETSASFDHRMFPKPFRRSRIILTDRFLQTVVPAIVEQAPELADEELTASPSLSELTDLYLFINRTLRQRNRDFVASFAGATTAHRQWQEPFLQLANSQVESGFADHRTYIYQDTEIDQQVHLGFDLASTANTSISAANTGTVLYADYLGIYGNCVFIDHGMGLQSLYAHLSSISVAVGDEVTRGQPLGNSGSTGLAGGDHLHFALFLQGHPVTPIEWWDEHWIEDRIERKLRQASISPLTAPSTR